MVPSQVFIVIGLTWPVWPRPHRTWLAKPRAVYLDSTDREDAMHRESRGGTRPMSTEQRQGPSPPQQGPGRLGWVRVALQAVQAIAVIMIHMWHDC